MDEIKTLNLFQLQLQILFKNTTQLITLESAKTDNEQKIEVLRDEILEAWGTRKKFGFQGSENNTIQINFADVNMIITQISSDKYIRK